MSDTDPPPGEGGAPEGPSDAEQVESEWHVWVIATLVVGGVALVLVPGDVGPRYLSFAGALLVVFGVLGWLFKRAAQEG